MSRRQERNVTFGTSFETPLKGHLDKLCWVSKLFFLGMRYSSYPRI